ncbi:zf-CCHC domain-containing protein [Tanacetum coccineum]
MEESKDLTSLSLDELIGNLKVYEMIIKKDSKIVREKVERKSLALKAKKESSDEECRFVRQPRNDKKTFQKSRDDKNGKSDRKCFRCGDPIHLIGECPKPPKDKNQRAFVGGSWSDSGEEDDKKVNNETFLVAQASSEVCFEFSYFIDENSSIDDLVLDNEYDKLCKMSLKIITKKKRLKATRYSLEKEISILNEKVSTLEKNKEVDLKCVKCHMIKIENKKLKEEALKLTKFEKSTHYLNEMLNNQKPSGEKLGLGFNSFEASFSETKEIKFMKALKKVSPDGGPINMGGPLNVQAAPKANMGPPPGTTARSEKIEGLLSHTLSIRIKSIDHWVIQLRFWYTSKGKFLVVLFDLSGPRRKSNHGLLGVDSEGGIPQVKESRIYLLVQQYKQYSIPENESIDIGFAKFNIRVTSLKALDESFSSKNYVRKFLRALHLKWRANVTTIEESKDLSSLSLNGLIGNLKVHEMIIEKDSELVGGKRKKIKSVAMSQKRVK